MAIKSSLFTAASDLKKYEITIPAAINSEDLIVNDSAKTYADGVKSAYTQLNKQFNELAKVLRQAKTKVNGSKLKNSITKAANRAEAQGGYCKNRLRDLNDAFKFTQVENKVKLLEDKLEQYANAQDSNGA